jgi:hypothetical protein
MTRMFGSAVLFALGTLLVSAGLADAGRVASTRVETYPSTGAHIDITVPYTTDGRSTFMGPNGVAPRITSGPGLGTVNDAQVRPVFNLPFYGASQSFNSGSVGAMPRQPNSLRPGR